VRGRSGPVSAFLAFLAGMMLGWASTVLWARPSPLARLGAVASVLIMGAALWLGEWP
jgi:hypothetical protein